MKDVTEEELKVIVISLDMKSDGEGRTKDNTKIKKTGNDEW